MCSFLLVQCKEHTSIAGRGSVFVNSRNLGPTSAARPPSALQPLVRPWEALAGLAGPVSSLPVLRFKTACGFHYRSNAGDAGSVPGPGGSQEPRSRPLVTARMRLERAAPGESPRVSRKEGPAQPKDK